MAVVTTVVRPMTGADVAAVADLETISFPQPWSESVLREELAGRDRTYLVAEDRDGRVVGYAGMLVTAGDAHVMTLAVDPPERRRGIGTRLVAALADAAISAGAARLTLEVRSGNGAAIRLYRRFGFEPAGIRPRYYRDDDAVVMWAPDIRSAGYRALLDGLVEGEI
jgi:ribosomal-protein-alanine N-acetyltransferase